jgi:hypothetical protein
MNWFHDRGKSQGFVNMAMNLRNEYKRKFNDRLDK